MRGAFCYVRLIEHIGENKIDYIDNVLDLIPSLSLSLKRKNNICKSSLSLRNYQRQALSSWIGAKVSGCVVLLTGAGNIMIGLE
jgi:superfamily II DNA or RNA helicase